MSNVIEDRGDFLLLFVKATPRSRKNEIGDVINGRLKIKVTAVAEKGKANRAIIKLLSKKLGIAASNIELSQGPTSSLKSFRISDIKEGAVREILGLD